MLGRKNEENRKIIDRFSSQIVFKSGKYVFDCQLAFS